MTHLSYTSKIRSEFGGFNVEEALTPATYKREAPKAGIRPVQVAVPTRRDDWQKDGRCVGMDPGIFFPSSGQNAARAKAICAMCMVREDCLEHALEQPEPFGVWGGLSERERHAILRARRGTKMKHGRGGYQLGCRCDECRDAYGEYSRAYRAKQAG